jgi:Clp amino terminal domain, pathogenicity island component
MTKARRTRGDYHPWTTFLYAADEARRRGDRNVGTDHLLLGLLREPALARALDTDLESARAMLEVMDREALRATIGTPLDSAPPPIYTPESPRPRPTLREVLRQRMRLTPVAKRAMERSSKDLRRGRVVEPRELLLELLALERPDPVAALLDALDVDRDTARAQLGMPAPA